MNWNSINNLPVNRDECLVLLLTKQDFGGIAGSPTCYRRRIKLGWWLPQIGCFRFEASDLFDANHQVAGWMELPDEPHSESGNLNPVFAKIDEIPHMSPAKTMSYLKVVFDLLAKREAVCQPPISIKNFHDLQINTLLRAVDTFADFLPEQILIGYLRCTYAYKHHLSWWLPLSKNVYEILRNRHEIDVVNQLMTGILPTDYYNGIMP